MLDFVIISSNKKNIKDLEYIIDKRLFKIKELYRCIKYNTANDKEFDKYLDNETTSTCYLIDVEDEKQIKKAIYKIRKIYKDLRSFIILLDNNKLLKNDIICEYNINTFIVKNTNYIEDINKIISSILNLNNKEDRMLIYNYNNLWYKIPFNDILYIEKELDKKVCKIVCKNNIIKTNKTINELITKLDESFIKTHRSTIINKDNIIKYDSNYNIVYFINNNETSLISRSMKNTIKSIFTI